MLDANDAHAEPAVAPESVLPDTPVTRLLAQAAAPAERQSKPFPAFTPARKRPGVPVLLAGVVLPVISFAVETVTRMCAREFFDPMPTVWHHLLVCAVPLANLWVWRVARRDAAVAGRTKLLEVANGLALGVAVFYTILYAPLLPLSLLALVFFGLGLLPLTPVLALLAGARLTVHLRRLRQAQHTLERPGEWRLAWVCGGVLAFSLLIAAELPGTLARLHLQAAASSDPATRLRGVRWLRAYGQEDAILRACYGRVEDKANLTGFLFNAVAPVSSLQAREVYYRVTGRSFDTVPANRVRRAAWGDERTRQTDATGELMEWPAPGLALGSSRLDGSLDAAAALGYLEWTLVFKNTAAWQSEARAHVALPPGGVVSRLTLWVNGEEREAAFAARGKVTAAYQAVVSQRRDPVLVTSSGPDRVQVQCFPVPPNGVMKVRLGITAPLTVAEREQGWLQLPRLVERNFDVSGDFAHSIWIEAKQPLEAASQHLKAEQPDTRLYAVRGQVPHAELAQRTPAVRVRRDPAVTRAWTADPYDQTAVIAQQSAEQEVAAPARVVFVVDGSRALQTEAGALADALTALPEGLEFGVLLAGDEVRELAPLQPATAERTRVAAAALRQVDFAGGTDNLAALTQAWELAAAQPRGALVWVHAPQPHLLGAAAQLRQAWERRPGNPLLYELQTRNGPNLVAEALDGISAVRPVARLGDTRADLARLFEGWRGGARQLVFTREKLKSNKPVTTDNSQQAARHLARLWAFEEVTRLLAVTSQPAAEAARDEAVKLAAAYQLVTPVTGAVVLETQEQYQRAGLQPVERGTVPTIPEPEVWALLAVALLLLSWVFYQQKRRGGAC